MFFIKIKKQLLKKSINIETTIQVVNIKLNQLDGKLEQVISNQKQLGNKLETIEKDLKNKNGLSPVSSKKKMNSNNFF